jgi:hypothetical protein
MLAGVGLTNDSCGVLALEKGKENDKNIIKPNKSPNLFIKLI